MLTTCHHQPVEALNPELFREAGRRGSVLTGKLVTRRESLKDPVPACVRYAVHAVLGLWNYETPTGGSGPPWPHG